MTEKLSNKKLKEIFQIANNAIYFDDSSDYKTALYEICKVIKQDDENIGDVFID